MTTGYSGTPLLKKLGIKAGHRLCFLNEPDDYRELLGPLPDGVTEVELDAGELDFVHGFYLATDDLKAAFPVLKAALKPDGTLWISWAKKASKIKTDVTREVVREVGLAGGLVDVKVGAIDESWSGLKFVYRVEDR